MEKALVELLHFKIEVVMAVRETFWIAIYQLHWTVHMLMMLVLNA